MGVYVIARSEATKQSLSKPQIFPEISIDSAGKLGEGTSPLHLDFRVVAGFLEHYSEDSGLSSPAILAVSSFLTYTVFLRSLYPSFDRVIT